MKQHHYRRLKQLLIQQAGKERQNLTLLLSGASVFFFGIGLIYYSERYIPPSITQEISALIGLLFSAAGGIVGALGYLCLSVLRIFKFINDDND